MRMYVPAPLDLTNWRKEGGGRPRQWGLLALSPHVESRGPNDPQDRALPAILLRELYVPPFQVI